ncbi:uncharacterized protein L201_003218 [Kwoniella dendrophila CBS 6074]|uniref:Fork-head domain-containing protein n=1 Tax=Kwoniella dendrophila CBS 6074 TaxID=1295534 RepID=A0AAX4JUT0_9TREE
MLDIPWADYDLSDGLLLPNDTSINSISAVDQDPANLMSTEIDLGMFGVFAQDELSLQMEPLDDLVNDTFPDNRAFNERSSCMYDIQPTDMVSNERITDSSHFPVPNDNLISDPFQDISFTGNCASFNQLTCPGLDPNDYQSHMVNTANENGYLPHSEVQHQDLIFGFSQDHGPSQYKDPRSHAQEGTAIESSSVGHIDNTDTTKRYNTRYDWEEYATKLFSEADPTKDLPCAWWMKIYRHQKKNNRSIKLSKLELDKHYEANTNENYSLNTIIGERSQDTGNRVLVRESMINLISQYSRRVISELSKEFSSVRYDAVSTPHTTSNSKEINPPEKRERADMRLFEPRTTKLLSLVMNSICFSHKPELDILTIRDLINTEFHTGTDTHVVESGAKTLENKFALEDELLEGTRYLMIEASKSPKKWGINYRTNRRRKRKIFKPI